MLPAVHQLAIYVHEKIVAHRGIVTIGAEKRLLHYAVFSRLPQNLPNGSFPPAAVQRVHVIVFLQLSYRHVTIRSQLRVTRLVQQLCV